MLLGSFGKKGSDKKGNGKDNSDSPAAPPPPAYSHSSSLVFARQGIVNLVTSLSAQLSPPALNFDLDLNSDSDLDHSEREATTTRTTRPKAKLNPLRRPGSIAAFKQHLASVLPPPTPPHQNLPVLQPPPLPDRVSGPSRSTPTSTSPPPSLSPSPPPPPPPPLPPRLPPRNASPLSTSSGALSDYCDCVSLGDHPQPDQSCCSDSSGNIYSMYRPTAGALPAQPAYHGGAGTGTGTGIANPHQPPMMYMPALAQPQVHVGQGSPMPMPQPMAMPLSPMAGGNAPSIGGMVQAPVQGHGIYPPPSPAPQAASHSVTSSLGSIHAHPNNQPVPSFHPPPQHFATNSSTKSSGSTSSTSSSLITGGHPPAAKYPGRNSQYFHDPTVPIPAIPDTMKRPLPMTSSASSIHSAVSSTHTLTTDPSILPREILDIDRRVMLFVSASGTNPMLLGTFPHDIEDVMFASSPAPYDMEILSEYSVTSLEAAAKQLLLFIKHMTFDTKRRIRVALVGIDVGGIVALEAVRMFLSVAARQMAQYNAQMADPRDRDANWLLRVTFDGVFCINSPVFLLHPTLFGNVDRQAFGHHVKLFAFPPEQPSVQEHGTGSSSGSGRKKDRGGVFGFGKLAKVVGGMASPNSVHDFQGSNATPAPVAQIPFDAAWDARLALMSPWIALPHDQRAKIVESLLAAKIPLAFLITQTSNPQAVTSPTFVFIPDHLPEHIRRLYVPFTTPPSSPVSSYHLIAEALDRGRQPGLCAQMIQYITKVATQWATSSK